MLIATLKCRLQFTTGTHSQQLHPQDRNDFQQIHSFSIQYKYHGDKRQTGQKWLIEKCHVSFHIVLPYKLILSVVISSIGSIRNLYVYTRMHYTTCSLH